MTPEAQQIALAELEGWQQGIDQDWISPDGICYVNLPDYLHDLNAIHELESTLSTTQYIDFVEWLSDIRTQECEDVCRCPSATAPQRAEAILRTLDRWMEDE